VRNTVAVARWVRLVATSDREAPDTYDEGFWNWRQDGDWAGFAELVRRHCAPASVVDVGCGDGRFLAALRGIDDEMVLLGVDGSSAAVSRARRRGLQVEQCNLVSWRQRDATRLSDRTAGFDVAVSLETAEHLPPWSAAGLIASLTQGRMAVFSAAHPGQGGTLHMNERPFDHWRRRFAEHRFHPAGSDDAFREAVRALDLPWWYAANVHLFERAAP
jgi:SAM-dependent methyltransferase